MARHRKKKRSVKRQRLAQIKAPAGFKIKRRRKPYATDAQLQRGLTVLRNTKDLHVAAKAARLPAEKFKREALKRKLIKKRGKNWAVSRDLHREMLIYSDGRRVAIKLRTGSARQAGKYMSAVGAFLRSNNIRILDQFIDRGVIDVTGKRHVFETNPNTLYRLTSSRDEAFEDIYRIVVN